VKYANITPNQYGIKYWEIGNENVGNGYYQNEDWEYDLHFLNQDAGARVGQSVLSPVAYGNNSVPFITAMKAVDPTIKCGVYQLAPDAYPNTLTPSYNSQVLQGSASVIDFVIIHWYPCGTDPAMCLQSPLQIAGIISGTHADLMTAAPTRAAQIQILITESGAGNITGPASALFAADEYLSWFENGVVNVDYQELHNGFLAAYNQDAGVADNSPEGPYYGGKMSSILAAPGDTFVTATSTSTMIGVHAVKKANGSRAIILINRSPTSSYSVTVNVAGATLGNCGTRYDFGQANFSGNFASSDVASSTVSGFQGSSFTITVPAYSMSIVENPG
jgi:alpha-L-arabinofuranosidase